MIAIIGGSGFYSFLEDAEKKALSTPYGLITVQLGCIESTDIIFIPRHFSDHSVAPSQVNYRANIYVAYENSVEAILCSNALGSMHQEIEPGSFVIPDDVLDQTTGRIGSFKTDQWYNDRFQEENGHLNLFNSDLRSLLMKNLKTLGFEYHDGGTVVVTNGPRFETPAEIRAYHIMGADYVGMTSAPEVFLAAELGIPYATLGIITNYAAGLQSIITSEEVFELFKDKIEDVKMVFYNLLSDLHSI